MPISNMASPHRSIFMALCAVLVLAGATLGVANALRAGPNWDDAFEIDVMNREIKVGATRGLNYEEAKAAYGDSHGLHIYYGVAMQYAAHAATSLLTGQSWASPEQPTLKRIAVRHLLTMLLALFGAAILAGAATLVSERKELGLSVGAVLMSTPVFLGQSAINVKDVPAGIGITIFSCGAALLLVEAHRARRFEPVAAAMIVAGTFLAVGTRAGTIAFIGFEAAAIGIFMALKSRLRETILLFAGLAAGAFIAAFTNPFGRKAPIQWLWESVAFSGSFNVSIPTTLYGETVQSSALPWWYVPGWIVIEYPIPFLVLALTGAIAGVACLRREGFERAYPWLPFFIQGAVLPLILVLEGATLYDRLRHLFFIVPPLCLLAGFGLEFLVSGLLTGSSLRKKALGLVGVASLIANFAATLIWHPYQYAYLNELARLFPQYSFDTDYWGVTVSESVARMKKLGVKEFRAGPAPVFFSYSLEGPPIVNYYQAGAPLVRGFYYVHSRPSRLAMGLPASCRPLFKVKRQNVILGVGGEC